MRSGTLHRSPTNRRIQRKPRVCCPRIHADRYGRAAAQLRLRRPADIRHAALARFAPRSPSGAAGRPSGVRNRARADVAPAIRARAARPLAGRHVPGRGGRWPVQPGDLRVHPLFSQRNGRLDRAAQEVGRCHPELARHDAGVDRGLAAHRRRRPASELAHLAQGTPRRCADIRPRGNQDPRAHRHRHGHWRPHRAETGRPAGAAASARSGARQSRDSLWRGLPARRLRAGAHRRRQRVVDRRSTSRSSCPCSASSCRLSRP